MDIEEYSKSSPQYYDSTISPLLKKYLDRGEYSSLLDCGCGDGSLLYALKQGNYLHNKKIFAIDLSQSRIQLVKQIDDRIIAKVDNAEQLNTIQQDSIDFFISTQVIEHISDTAFLHTISRVVKQHGTVYISTVYKKWYGWYFYRHKQKWVLDPTHVREYREDSELLRLFDKKAFQLLESNKKLIWFPVADFFIKRLAIRDRYLFKHAFPSIMRKLKIPIIGYYNWEIVLKRK